MKHESFITDLKFLVPLKYNSHAELSKGRNKARHLEWPTDGSYSRIPDEEFTLDATGDFFKSPRNTVKKDLSRLELYQLDSSEEHNVYPHSSFPLPRATNSQKNIVSKCKHLLTRTEFKSQCMHDHANENDLLESLCKMYLRLSVNGLNRNELVTSERDSRGKLAWSEAVQRVSPDQLAIGGAGMVAGNTALDEDSIQSFFNGILGNLGVSYAGKGRDVGLDRADGREVFGNLGIGGQSGVYGNVGVGDKANLYNDGNLGESTLIKMRGHKEGIGFPALGAGLPLQPSALSAGVGHRGEEGEHAANVKLKEIEVFSNGKYKESHESVDLATAAESDNHKKNVEPLNYLYDDVSPIRCLLGALLNPKQDGQIGDLTFKAYHFGIVGDEPLKGCLHYRNLKTRLEAARAAPAPPPTVGRFRPLGGRRADWVTMGANGKDKRKPFLVI